MDFSPYFWTTTILITAAWLLWKRKRRWMMGFLILSAITAWIDPYFQQPTLQGQFVYEISTYLAAVIGTYILLGRNTMGDS